MALTVEEENAIALSARKMRARELRDAFLKLFGPPAARTPYGKIAIEELEKFCSFGDPVLQKDDHGQTDIYRTGIQEGRRQVMQTIHNLIQWREDEHPSDGRTQ